MKIEVFTLCDFANTDAAGKLNILGSFDRINANAMPMVYPVCVLAIKMRFERLEEGPKRVRISFIDEDGRQIMGLEAQTTIQFPPGETSATAPLVILMPQLRLQNFGEYSIDLAVDGRQEASIPLFVRQVQPPTPPQIQAPAPETPPAQ